MAKVKVNVSESNAARRRRSREASIDKIVGDQLADTPPKVSLEHRVGKLRKKVLGKHKRGHMNDIKQLSKMAEVKSVVSLSSDVIFCPSTQTTRYSVTRSAKQNLQRRMGGYDIKVADTMTGEGLIYFTASKELVVDGKSVKITAKCAASASDMSAHSIKLESDEHAVLIEPAGTAVSPEESAQIFQRIAENYLRNQ